jgi:long-chain fatty acid transport protein
LRSANARQPCGSIVGNDAANEGTALSRTATTLRAFALTAAAVALPTRAPAQTSDALFGGWTSRPREAGSRAAGLGGAFVAVADDARAAVLNPAGVALVPGTELAAATADLWDVAAVALRGEPGAVPPRPGGMAGPTTPCAPRPSRPWAVAFFAEQALEQTTRTDLVAGPRLVEQGTLRGKTEQIGLGVAKGLAPWLNLGLTVSWRHLRLDGSSALSTAEGADLRRLTLEGDANKARAIVGALAIFGPTSGHSGARVGLAFAHDLSRWSVERRGLDVDAGTVSAPSRVHIEEPPVLSGGVAWRLADRWLISGQVDYVWYRQVLETLRGNAPGEDGQAFRLRNGVEPRLGIEYTAPAPIGGYFKLRAGLRRETSGRLRYDGPDLARQQAFRGAPDALRGSAGVSLFGEFYDRAARLDLDLSQVVVATSSTLAAAGGRRFSIGLTVRL